jgi:putative ABC transport system substrate-binding protein
MSICLQRREFIAGLGGAAAWPLAARALRGDRVRRIGWLLVGDENLPLTKLRRSALTRALADLSWAKGRNVPLSTQAGLAVGLPVTAASPLGSRSTAGKDWIAI